MTSPWHALSLLSHVDLDPDTAKQAVDHLSGHDPTVLADIAIRWRVVNLLLANLENAELTASLATLVQLLDEDRRQDSLRIAEALPVTMSVLEQAEACGCRVIKGLAYRDLYPRPDLRHMGDIDLQAPTWPIALAMVGWLRDRGWQWDTSEYPWLKWDDAGMLYGQLPLVLPDNATPVARVDMHIGPFSVGHAGLLPLIGWRRGEALGVPVTVPDRETSIALLTAHAVGDGLLSMKDVNDLHLLLQTGTPDWTSTVELCRAAHVSEALSLLLSALEDAYPGHDLPQGVLAAAGSSPLAGSAQGHLQVLAEDRARRAERIAELCLRDELARGNSPDQAIREAAVARRYYSADLRPRSGTPTSDGAAPGHTGRGRCWRLVPEQRWDRLASTGGEAARRHRELAPGLTLVTAGPAMAIQLGTDIMTPTVWGEVDPRSVWLARELRK
ncbi:nucleotidyltransferase family protein [Nonomuraea sp. NPDC049695]|uniref:nucleotidyltransferase family protein n=1 Tax=Nonomuraea sp. NPDC049695 TaxID=3154734 RepID=UPI0034180BD2